MDGIQHRHSTCGMIRTKDSQCFASDHVSPFVLFPTTRQVRLENGRDVAGNDFGVIMEFCVCPDSFSFSFLFPVSFIVVTAGIIGSAAAAASAAASVVETNALVSFFSGLNCLTAGYPLDS